MKYWFTSDTHFGHENIIKLSNRPFKNAKEMDRVLIDTYNRMVKPNDYLYILGDFCWGNTNDLLNYRAQIKCNNVIMIWGNHDMHVRYDERAQQAFKSTHDLLDITINRQDIVLFHYPILEWNRFFRGSWHLYGHVHGNINHFPGALAVDVGVDVQNYEPVDFEILQHIMSRRKMFNAKSINDYVKEQGVTNASNI